MGHLGQIVLLPASLPDLAHPSSVAFIAALVSFVASARARARRQPPDAVTKATTDGTFVGIGAGLAIYCIANIVGSI